MLSETRSCLECGTRIGGRLDKKYCSDLCRTSYNNRLNGVDTRYVRHVNHILRKNRRILLTLNPGGKCRIPLQRLKTLGFDFAYFTSTYTTKDGACYYYCYEQGYLAMHNDIVLLVVKKDML